MLGQCANKSPSKYIRKRVIFASKKTKYQIFHYQYFLKKYAPSVDETSIKYTPNHRGYANNLSFVFHCIWYDTLELQLMTTIVIFKSNTKN